MGDGVGLNVECPVFIPGESGFRFAQLRFALFNIQVLAGVSGGNLGVFFGCHAWGGGLFVSMVFL